MGDETDDYVEKEKVPALYKSGYIRCKSGKKTKLKMGTVVGIGGNSIVSNAVTSSGDKLAVKCVRLKGPLRSFVRTVNPMLWLPPTGAVVETSFPEREVKALKECIDCPYIVKFLGSAKFFCFYWIGMELCMYPCVNVFEAFANKPRLRSMMALHLCIPLLRALEEINKRGFIHRDVKIQNVMVSFLGIPKLCDFGLCIEQSNIDEELKTTKFVPGTEYYQAPEAVLCQRYDIKADLFGLAVTILRAKCNVTIQEMFENLKWPDIKDILFGKSSYSVEKLQKIFIKCTEDHVYPSQQTMRWKRMEPVLLGMLALDSEKRWDLDKVMGSEVVASTMADWDAFMSKGTYSNRFHFMHAVLAVAAAHKADPEFAKLADDDVSYNYDD